MSNAGKRFPVGAWLSAIDKNQKLNLKILTVMTKT